MIFWVNIVGAQCNGPHVQRDARPQELVGTAAM